MLSSGPVPHGHPPRQPPQTSGPGVITKQPRPAFSLLEAPDALVATPAELIRSRSKCSSVVPEQPEGFGLMSKLNSRRCPGSSERVGCGSRDTQRASTYAEVESQAMSPEASSAFSSTIGSRIARLSTGTSNRTARSNTTDFQKVSSAGGFDSFWYQTVHKVQSLVAPFKCPPTVLYLPGFALYPHPFSNR